MPTFDVARDDVLGAFTAKWNADTPALVGSAPKIFYDGLGELGPGPHDAPWARVQVRHTFGDVSGLGGPPGQRRRTTKFGLVTVQVFTPLFDDDGTPRGTALNEELCKVAKAAFEAKVTQNDVTFRRVRPVEVGEDGPWYQSNVLAEFEYDEFV